MKKILIFISVFSFLSISNAVDTKVSDLTEDTAPTTDDLLYTVDDPSGTPASRKATIANVLDNAIKLQDTLQTGATFYVSSGTVESGFMVNGELNPAGGVTDGTLEEADIGDLTHTTDTGPSPDCSGTTTYQDGEAGCDDISDVYVDGSDTISGDGTATFNPGGATTLTVTDDSHNHATGTITTDLIWDTTVLQSGSTFYVSSGTVDAELNVPADTIDAITEIASALKTGSDATIVTGTSGSTGDCVEWDSNGDIVTAGAPCGTSGGTASTLEVLIEPVSSSPTATINLSSDTFVGVAASSTMTITMNFSSITALGQTIDLADTGEITGTLAVGNGGSGATSLTDGGVLLGSGSSAFTALGVLADGSIIVGDGATDPVALAAFTNSTGDLIHEAGGLEADVSAFAGVVAVNGGSTVEVNSKAELETQIADVADFAEADGDTFTGVHDFGGATSLEIVNGTGPNVDTEGQVEITTDAYTTTGSSGTITFYSNGTTYYVAATTGVASDNNIVKFDATLNQWSLEADAGGGAFDDTGDPIVQNTTTKDVHVGDGAGTLAGKLEIGGDADQPQLVVEGFSPQTDSLAIFQQDDDTEVTTIEDSGLITTLVGIDAIGAVDFDIASADVTDVTVVTDGGTVILDGDITQDAGTTLFMGGLLDATGNVDMDYGSADIDDHTFTTDGTGTAEFVIPAQSIDSTEILNATLVDADMADEALDADKIVDDTVDDNDLDVVAGGTGVSTLADGSVLLGSGTGDITAQALATTEILIGDGVGDPTSAALSGDATMTNGGVVTVVDDSHNHVITNIDAFTKANLETQTSDVADYAEADGDVYTNAHDFGGAGSLEIPQAAVPTLDAVGEIALDTLLNDFQPTVAYATSTTAGEMYMVAISSTEYHSVADNEIVKYDAALNQFRLETETAGGTGAFSDAGDPIVQNTTGKDVHVGDGAGTLTGKLEVGGDADQPQLVVEQHSAQTDDPFIIQQDDDAELFSISPSPSIKLLEVADAPGDTANYGQIWVNLATPNELFFTDDAGTDFQLGAGGTDTNAPKLYSFSAAGLLAHIPDGVAEFDGVAPVTQDDGTNLDIWVASFDDTADECRGFQIIMPEDIDTSGSAEFYVTWYSQTATTGSSMWYVAVSSASEGESWDFIPGDFPAASDAVQGTVDLVTETTWTDTISALGWLAEQTVIGWFCRDGDGDQGTDDLVGDAEVIVFGIKVPRT